MNVMIEFTVHTHSYCRILRYAQNSMQRRYTGIMETFLRCILVR